MIALLVNSHSYGKWTRIEDAFVFLVVFHCYVSLPQGSDLVIRGIFFKKGWSDKVSSVFFPLISLFFCFLNHQAFNQTHPTHRRSSQAANSLQTCFDGSMLDENVAWNWSMVPRYKADSCCGCLVGRIRANGDTPVILENL